jgi:hypothetical protein
MNYFWVLFIIFALLVAGDKIITMFNIHHVNKNFNLAEKDRYSVEKNPLAKWLFEKFGLWRGTAIYYPLSILTLFTAYGLFRLFLGQRVSLYIVMMLYGLVIMNNLYFLLKYLRIIP